MSQAKRERYILDKDVDVSSPSNSLTGNLFYSPTKDCFIRENTHVRPFHRQINTLSQCFDIKRRADVEQFPETVKINLILN